MVVNVVALASFAVIAVVGVLPVAVVRVAVVAVVGSRANTQRRDMASSNFPSLAFDLEGSCHRANRARATLYMTTTLFFYIFSMGE